MSHACYFIMEPGSCLVLSDVFFEQIFSTMRQIKEKFIPRRNTIIFCVLVQHKNEEEYFSPRM